MLLGQGAEAILHKEGAKVIKDRIRKTYRHPVLDSQLRKARTRREVKILQQLPVPGPRLLRTDNTTIQMSYVKGVLVKKILDSQPALATEIGRIVARLHDAGIVHGDLTTSNMLYDPAAHSIALIDFGLSQFSTKAEDRAVDLHLFRQALESKHHLVHKKAWRFFLQGYTNAKHAKETIQRLTIVESRGRYKERS